MSDAHGSIPATTRGHWFETTHWSVVLTAGQKPSPQSREALEKLCRAYWQPLYAYVRRRGASPHEAQDLTQAFFLHFLEQNALAGLRPSGGKFRSFLLACLKNYLANERERARTQRRGGGRPPISLDSTDAETRYSLEPVDDRTPEAVFERRWAFAVLEQTMRELRREFSNGAQRQQFEELEGFLPGGHASGSRAELAARRGVSVGAIDVSIHRLRRRFGALLREQVAQTVSPEAEIEEEIRHLISVIGS